jgi:phage/plasmid-associated DNA primase
MQARQLYRESEVFDIQFKLIVATNYLFEMNTMDDGTWRRIRICDFMSKFAYKHEMDEMKKENKYVFERDDTFKDKLPELAPFFMSMLVDRAHKTQGVVNDCSVVENYAKGYRCEQNPFNQFIDDIIV